MAALWRLPLGGIIGTGLLLLAPVAPARPDAVNTPPPVAPAALPAVDGAPSIIDMTVNDTDRMTVAIHIAGRGPYAFIVDTAATRTVISRELANTLALKPTGNVRLITLTGGGNASMVRIPDLRFTPGKSHDVQALALGGTHIGAHGILGIDTLRDQRVVLDFKARTLAVSDVRRGQSFKPERDEIVVTARRKLGQLILADSTIDDEKIDVIVDTGTQISLGNEALRRRLMKSGSRYAVKPIALIGVTGDVLNADYTRVDQLRIGRIALHGMPIAFGDAYAFRKLKLRKPALLLGMDALRMFERVTVDFPNRRASFVMPETPVTASGVGR
ncbi:aspartyl protease family protein [Sphingomonas sp. LaA6.9]|uniref:aspartyl protease family protein n=1 Tax=Sphingomonas sp. LaA6.9 TaxID=2919914 RepID=UPI001F4FB245|nr:aspartyl protease family protein [Sphingomonas sp. LaA6.9]MCJ8159546.1 aspartyl protease family protein [Sphingomonas sp. LaA6.9]